MSINFNPGPKIQNLLDQDLWWTIVNYNALTQAVAGTGSTERNMANLAAITGTTSGSTALARSGANTKLSRGKSPNVINWSKKVILHFTITVSSATTNGIARFTLGKDTANGVGVMDKKGIGIQIDNLALKGIVHDGTSGETVDLSVTLTTSQVYQITIVSDGAGNIEWFVDEVSKGTSTGGPTGDGTEGNSVFQIESDNGADSANQTLRMGPLSIYVEQ